MKWVVNVSFKVLNFNGFLWQRVVLYQWLQDSLSSGEKVPEELYLVNLDADKSSSDYNSTENETPNPKKTKLSPENSPHTPSPKTPKALNEDQVTPLQSSSPYSPPDLNSNITQIFGKLINIYRGEVQLVLVVVDMLHFWFYEF